MTIFDLLSDGDGGKGFWIAIEPFFSVNLIGAVSTLFISDERGSEILKPFTTLNR